MESWNKLSYGLSLHGDFSSLCDHKDVVFFIRHRRRLEECNNVGPFFQRTHVDDLDDRRAMGQTHGIMFQRQHAGAFKHVDFIDRGLLKVS
jgi:hypothetical protein